jgi:hypothetical protein
MTEKSILKDSDVRWDEREGRPRKVRGEFALPLADTTEDAIKRFLHENADELHFWVGDENLKVTQDVQTASRRVVRYQQLHDGIPVFGTTVVVRLDKSNRIKQMDLRHIPRVRVAAPTADQKLTAAKAKKAALGSLRDHRLRQKMDKPEQVYYPTSDGLRLAYLFMIPTKEPLHDWRIIVDAFSGEVLKKDDRIVHMPDGQGLVFDPNPVVTSGNNTLRNVGATVAGCGFAGTNTATIDAERVTRTLRDITLSGGTHKLEGPFVKLRNFGDPDIAPPEEANANDFDYSSGDDDFEAVMVYYHVDTVQRYISDPWPAGLGITTAHNAQIEADAHDSLLLWWGTYNGAWFSPIDGGIHFGNSDEDGAIGCKPDRGEDADAIIHEYGHAIQNDQVPGWGDPNPTTGRNETGAMGEGFGDILACVFFAPDHQFQQEVFEDWCFADEGGMRSCDGTKVYPTDWVDRVHSDGEIWSAALWNIYLGIGGDSTTDLAKRQAARGELLRTLIQSHYLVAVDATMPDAAEHFMDTNEEDEEFLGRHSIEMLDSFHDRGILACEAGSDMKITQLWSQQDDLSTRSWEQVEAGQDNWFYATITNASTTTTARALVVTFSFKSPFSTPVYPGDFRDNIISATAEFNLAPGETRTVKARWPEELIPAIPAGASKRHGCILAEIYNPEDHVPAGVTSIGASNGKLKQRNTDIVDMLPDTTTDYFFDMSSFHLKKEKLARLEVIRPQKFEAMEISFSHRNPLVVKKLVENVKLIEARAVRPVEGIATVGTRVSVLDPTRVSIRSRTELPLVFHLARGSAIMAPDRPAPEGDAVDAIDEDFTRCDVDLDESGDMPILRLRPGRRVGLPYMMKPRDRARMRMRIRAPRDAKPGDRFTVEVVQRNRKGELLGGFDIQVNIVDQ